MRSTGVHGWVSDAPAVRKRLNTCVRNCVFGQPEVFRNEFKQCQPTVFVLKLFQKVHWSEGGFANLVKRVYVSEGRVLKSFQTVAFPGWHLLKPFQKSKF